jgi:hypothetical protein
MEYDMTSENAPTETQAADMLAFFEKARIAPRRALEWGHAAGSALRTT